MKLLLVTPLFPPDIAEPAPYVKELTRRLSEEHEVTVLLYGRYPEQVEGARYLCVDKRRSRMSRILSFSAALFTASKHADILYVENGPSTELPMLVLSLLSNTPYIFHVGDRSAHDRAHTSLPLRTLERAVARRARACIDARPCNKPEILPFAPYPYADKDVYERWWSAHLSLLKDTFNHVQ